MTATAHRRQRAASQTRVRAASPTSSRAPAGRACSCTACCSTAICGAISWRICPTSAAASPWICWRTATPRSRPDQDVSVTANADDAAASSSMRSSIEQVDLVGNDSGGGIAQIFAALAPAARAQPHAHRLRRPRQLAAGGLQAVPRDGGRRRAARHARRDAGRQERLPLAAGARAGLRASRAGDRRRPSRPICGRWSGPSSARATSSASSPPSTASTPSRSRRG